MGINSIMTAQTAIADFTYFFSAVSVRFLTGRFIGEYNSDIGKTSDPE